LLHCMSPEVALSGQSSGADECLFSGVKRTTNAQIELFRF
jgi:hypothetical protein